MSRLIGKKFSVSTSSASGIFDIREQMDYKKRGIWPPVPIITSGLVMHLSAIETSSYPGTGTTWNDISGSGYTGTLVNSPTFSTDRFLFNGSTQSVSVSPNPGTTLANTFTMEVWLRPTTTHEIDAQSTSGTGGVNNQRYVIGAENGAGNAGAGISAGTNGISVYEHGSGYMPALLVYAGTISSTNITQVVVVYINKQPRLYLNGSLVATGLTSTRGAVYGYMANIGTGPYGFFPGDISIVRAYNRALDATEVTQNFNANKFIFGL